jgi:hypothetical protein
MIPTPTLHEFESSEFDFRRQDAKEELAVNLETMRYSTGVDDRCDLPLVEGQCGLSSKETLVKKNDVDFGATVEQFQEFLGQNGYPKSILWLTPEDVLLSGKTVRVCARSYPCCELDEGP